MAQFENACGECGYTTGWCSQSEADERLVRHYLDRHPTVAPGGAHRVRDGDPSAGGCGSCLLVLVVLIVLVAILSNR